MARLPTLGPEASDYGTYVTQSSDLSVAISDAFRRAGISIPFPQRDLHVRSVHAPAADALRGRPA